MNGRKPTSKKPAARKSSYHSVPVRTSQSGKSGGGTKYSKPRKQKTPAAVIVSNILMICVILSVGGVIFAVAYNNIQYDKADAAKNASSDTAVVSSVQSEPESQPAESSAPTSSAVSSAAGNETSENSAPAEELLSEAYSKDFFKNDLFIGDSIFTGLYLYEFINRGGVAAAVGYTPYGAQNMPFDEEYYKGSAVDYAKQYDPDRIIIMLGSNCLTAQTDFDDFKSEYKTLITKLRAACPTSKIIVVSVPPITSDSSLASYSYITNEIIDTANGRLRELCVETATNYFDLNSLLKDGNGYFREEYAEVDGLHFLGRTYKVLLSALQDYMTKQGWVSAR